MIWRWTPLVLLWALFMAGRSSAAPAETAAIEDLAWHEVTAAVVEGKGWSDTGQPFDRLPARAQQIVRPPVWELSRDSAGLYVDFETEAANISVRWTLNTEQLAMPHMPATGVSGVDLYARRGGRWHFLANGRPECYPINEVVIVEGLKPGAGEYRLYFPLYNGVTEMEIGVAADAAFRFAKQRGAQIKPVVVYGTSITQGGCASRPGMSYPAILGRRLNVPVINLGFSGNGKAEPEMARLLAELDPAALVLDAVPNLYAQQVGERMPEFIEILRARQPEVPILLVESPIFPDSLFVAERAERVAQSNQWLRKVYQDRIAGGDRRLTIIPACDQTAEGGEATVDSLHPTDLGFLQMADSIEPYLRRALD